MRWDELISKEPITDGARVGIGFDGSHAHDGTALVICTEVGALSLELLIERHERDPLNWTVPRERVHAAVADLFERFEVVRLYADPYFWRSEVDEWSRQFGEGRVLEFPTNSVRRFGPAVDRFHAAMATGSVSHPGDHDLTRHVLNARLVRGGGRAQDDGHALYTLEKPGPGRLIDAAVAAILSFEAMAAGLTKAPEVESVYEQRGLLVFG